MCRNGKTTHKVCQEVYELDVCNGNYCTLIKLEARRSSGGESGGPVYWGRKAFGLHQGAAGYPRRDVFSRVDMLFDAMRVSIILDN